MTGILRWMTGPDRVWRKGIFGRTGITFGALVLLLTLLTGCHGKQQSEEFTLPTSYNSGKQYEITFWAKNDTNKNQVRIYEQAIADFETLYPNISVGLRLYTDYGKIYNDVITNIATGTTPNVCISYPDHIATYMTGSNVVVPLDALMDDAEIGLGGSALAFDSPSRDEVVPEFLSECVIGEHTYALPYMRSTEAVYINKTFVEKLGYEVPEILTWDYIFEVSEAAAQKGEDGNYLLNGQKVMIPMIYKSTDNMMISMLKQLGAGYSTDEGEILMFNDKTRELLKEIAVHARSGAFSTFKISSYPANFLDAGQCVFAIDSTAGATWMGSEAPLSDISADKIVEFETAVRPIPQFDVGHPQMISQGPSVCIFNKPDSGEVQAAWMFAQYLLTNEVQIAYSQTEGYVPVTRKAQEDPVYLDYLERSGEDNTTHYPVKIEAAQMLMANTENTFVTPVFNGSASLRDAAGALIEETTKSVRRKQKVNDAYFDDLFEKIRSLYRLDQLGSQNAAESGDRSALGPLPGTAKALLGGLAAAWVLIILVFLRQTRRKSA